MVPCFWVLRLVQLLANSKDLNSASHFKPTLPPPKKNPLEKSLKTFLFLKLGLKFSGLWIPGCNYPSRPQIGFVCCSKEIRALEANFRESSITRFVHLFYSAHYCIFILQPYNLSLSISGTWTKKWHVFWFIRELFHCFFHRWLVILTKVPSQCWKTMPSKCSWRSALWLLFHGTSGFTDIWLSQAQSKPRAWKTRADCTWNQSDNGGRK